MRRRLWLVPLVLVLGAWGSCVPVTGGDDVAGMSTAGLAALVAGEDWHYVGATGEPAFAGAWTNAVSDQPVAFRLREAGVVDLVGITEGGVAGSTIFTLPVGYRPSYNFIAPGTGAVAAGTVPAFLSVSTTGVVTVRGSVEPEYVYLAQFIFLDQPGPVP